MSIVVIKPGMLSSLQDLGRWNYQALGVCVCGAMDPSAIRLANVLVANQETLAVLEMTLNGSSLLFENHACIAITGAHLSPHIDDHPIENNRAYLLTRGQTLHFKGAQSGARAYLAVHGGFKQAPVLGSVSTDRKTALGGINGRALNKLDRLYLNGSFKAESLAKIESKLNSRRIYLSGGMGIQQRDTIRVIAGTHWPAFTAQAHEDFLQATFKVTPQSDRMGYRLEGPKLVLRTPTQTLSEPVNVGTIQVPADGNPICLMADRQSTGGYPKIANIITADLGYMAQMLPSQSLHFSLTTLAHAQKIWAERYTRFAQLREQLRDISERLTQNFVPFKED